MLVRHPMSTLQQEYVLRDFEEQVLRIIMEVRERKSQENLQLINLYFSSICY